MMQTLSFFMQKHKGMVFHIGTIAQGGWVMVGTKDDLNKKEHKRFQSEKFFTEHQAAKRREEIIQLVQENYLDSAVSRIRALQRSIKNHGRTINAIPKFSYWSKRFVLESFPLLEPNHIAVIVQGTERGRYWDRDEYMNETPTEDNYE